MTVNRLRFTVYSFQLFSVHGSRFTVYGSRFTIDDSWSSFAEMDHPIILFDGVCNYCNSMVNFIIRQDKKKIFRFAALQSTAGQNLLQQHHLPINKLDSFILIDKNEVYQKSSAGLRLYNKLSWYWKWTQALWVVPKFLRDAVYDFIARNRYKWFGKKEECMIPTSDVRERFLE